MDTAIIYKIIFAILAYLLGAFPTGYIIYWFKTGGGDIRTKGSGSLGGTNVIRTVNWPLGAVTYFIDILKGFIPILVIYFIWPNDHIFLAITSVLPVLGHDFPVFLRFKGGKGISTSYGVMTGLCVFPFMSGHPLWLRLLPVIIITFVWLTVFAASRIVSLASLFAAVSVPLSFYFCRYHLPVVIASICLFILAFITHRDNIVRLIRKEEKKIIRKGA